MPDFDLVIIGGSTGGASLRRDASQRPPSQTDSWSLIGAAITTLVGLFAGLTHGGDEPTP